MMSFSLWTMDCKGIRESGTEWHREFMKGFERRDFPSPSFFDRPSGPQLRVK